MFFSLRLFKLQKFIKNKRKEKKSFSTKTEEKYSTRILGMYDSSYLMKVFDLI
jgi:hypothetical protein